MAWWEILCAIVLGGSVLLGLVAVILTAGCS